MGQKFYFFTDPALLVQQTPAQAYGPQGVVNGKDIYQITDVHTATAKAAAFAVCDGLVAAQYDDSGTISIILKPTQQPPFDFPFISYFIYKGIDPASLLGSDGRVDTSQTTNDLVSAIKKAWELPDNNNSATKPSKNCLGLHLNPTAYLLEYPNDQNQTRFASDKPIENLFYEGDPNFQMTPLKAGNRIGTFAAAGFGFEIVLERMSYRPNIGLTRKFKNLIEVDILDTAVSYAPDDAPYFMHWHAKEDCLNFIDPCAFWGGFISASIQVWDGVDSKFKKRTGHEIYENILQGNVNAFSNRNKIYLDLRNETGQSINYYKARGPMIQLALDPEADIDASQVNYYGSGWPLLILDNPALPTGTSGTSAEIRYAIPKSGPAETVLFVCAGYGKKLRDLKDEDRFPRTYRRADSNYLLETKFAVPLINDAGTNKTQSCYVKIFAFQRVKGLRVEPISPSLDDLAPKHITPFDRFFPLITNNFIPSKTNQVVMRTFHDPIFIESFSNGAIDCVAKLTLAFDSQHIIFAILPEMFLIGKSDSGSKRKKDTWNPIEIAQDGQNAFSFLQNRLPFQLTFANAMDPIDASNVHILVAEGLAKEASDTADTIICIASTDYVDLLFIVLNDVNRIDLAQVGFKAGDRSGQGPTIIRRFELNVSWLSSGQKIIRQEQSSTLRMFEHVSVE
jgi:hypothetical protein